ncbi:MAG: cytochrome P450 [Pseudomonadota bacterium]
MSQPRSTRRSLPDPLPLPPKPAARPEKVSFWRHLRLFRRDLLSSQPAKLYRAWMAEFRTPFFQSYMINDPELVRLVLRERPKDFPKSRRVSEGLRPLLGESVFLTNGEVWERQRRIIDPAFEGGRLRDTYPAMWAAAEAAVARLGEGGTLEIEAQTSHAAADVIFRTLFSIPIEAPVARDVFEAFRVYQRTQPIVNIAAFVPLPRWVPRLFSRQTRASAVRIRALISQLTFERARRIASGDAPDDLATKILTTRDPETGETLSPEEMVDQVAIFFLAGHETSASALAWGLYLLALYPEWQERVAEEGARLTGGSLGEVSTLSLTRDVFRETLRLYPPVPMMVREATRDERFRGRDVNPGAQVVISPWHIHRHERFWRDGDAFDPNRWRNDGDARDMRDAYLPFSAGPRVCTGAGFAMAEGCLLLARLAAAFEFAPVPNRVPVPVAHLTVRGREGVWLQVTPRSARLSSPSPVAS